MKAHRSGLGVGGSLKIRSPSPVRAGEEKGENEEWNQGHGMRNFRHPSGNKVDFGAHEASQHHGQKRVSRDQAGGEEDAASCLDSGEWFRGFSLHEKPVKNATDNDWRRKMYLQVKTDGERKGVDAEKLHNDSSSHSDEDEVPRKVRLHDPLDDQGHDCSLRMPSSLLPKP